MRLQARLLGLALAGLVLSACGAPASGGGPQPLNPLSRWRLQVEPQMDRIALAVHDAGLSEPQRAALADIALRARAEGSPEIIIEAPSGDDPASLQMAYSAAESLRGAGVPVRLAAYTAPHPRAPVLIGYTRLQAVVQDCSTQWGSLTRHADNGTALGLGCATISNMAAQISDPRDILGQRPMDPADAGRRSVVIQAYRAGEDTRTQSEDATAQLSDAID
jgi:pilus assembly protein CpaD